MAGQIKALSMIVAIEELIPDRRLSRSGTQPAAPPVEPDTYTAEWLRKQQHQPEGEQPGDPVDAAKTSPAEPAPKPANDTPDLDRNQPSFANPFINPGSPNWVPDATGGIFDAVLDRPSSLRRSFSPDRRFSGRRR